MQLHDFYTGKVFDAYTYFGAHIEENGVRFRVYAPNATGVAIIGEFNNWNGDSMQLEAHGVYTFFSTNAKKGMMYKYRVYHKNGSFTEKTDPYAFGMELRPNSASIIVDLNEYKFTDEKWIENRDTNYNKPLNIYEVHAGSWKKKDDEDEEGWYTYKELADILIPYVKKSGYTHIEFLPLSEHPFDGSWGYQSTGFFSPTSRYGTASELMELVDRCHKAGIGVIMDFVPVHFAVDYYGLIEFDGTPLYEYPNNDVTFSEWGSCNFMHSRGETCSFLQSSANYWIKEFHFDGIRMDAISNAIYWQGNPARGVNKCTVDFLKNMNSGLHSLNKGIMLLAEDSTSYLKVTAPVEYDGLGFDYKWDMGFMNDTLNFFKTPPEERKHHYNKISFSMMYFYNELYLLPFSHDEVVHGKATIIQKMWGDYDDKFKQCKTLYMYMYTHPGKKLNFMGNEFGQFREWDEKRGQDFDLLKYPMHDSFNKFMIELNKIYLSEQALYEGEYNSQCFRWLEVDASEEVVYAYQRTCGDSSIIVVLNMSNNEYKDFKVGIDSSIVLKEILNTNSIVYSGTEKVSKKEIKAIKEQYKGWEYNFSVNLAPFSSKMFKVVKKKKVKSNIVEKVSNIGEKKK